MIFPLHKARFRRAFYKSAQCTDRAFYEIVHYCLPGCVADSLQEGKENHINLTLGNSSTISILLNYLYTLEYKNKNGDILVSHVKVYEAASFYGIPALQKLVVKEFEHHLHMRYDSLPKAIEAIYNDIPSFDRTLQDLALDSIVKNSGTLLGTSEEEATELSKMMDDLPQLGKDLTYHLLLENAKIKAAIGSIPAPDSTPGWCIHELQCESCQWNLDLIFRRHPHETADGAPNMTSP